jgi:SPP1 family predicted phage head-tail adaptor
MRRINAGKYRQPITIQSKSLTGQDSYGGSSEVWSTFMSVSAGIFPLTGTEKFQADVITAEITHRIHMRYIPSVSPEMRIIFGTRVFYITSIVNLEERNVELQLFCKEIVK